MIAYFLSLFLSFNAGNVDLPVVLHFEHLANSKSLKRNEAFTIASGNTIAIKQWKYYVSHIKLRQKDGSLVEVPGVFLIDAFGKDSITFQLPKAKYTSILFSVGIDSSLHMSGAQDGDLDPLNGMYWAWNTGYIHFKLEGEGTAMGKELQRFQYHIGGFAGKNNTMREITIPFNNTFSLHEKNTVLPNIVVDAAKFLSNKILENEKPLIMKEGENAVSISAFFPLLFSIQKIKNARPPYNSY